MKELLKIHMSCYCFKDLAVAVAVAVAVAGTRRNSEPVMMGFYTWKI